MTAITNLYNSIMGMVLRALGDWFLPTFARFSFAAVLLAYYWKSATGKLGDGFLGIFSPSGNAYAQIFPEKADKVFYDPAAFSWFEWLVALAGTWAEFILPFLIVVGLFTRLASIGMIGFVIVQSVVDITAHGTEWGGWFWWHTNPDSVILDQRLLWFVVLAILIVKGAGPLSLDRLLAKPAED